MSLDIRYFGSNYPETGITDGGAGSYSSTTSGDLSFEVIEVSTDVGVRGVMHQYPYRDKPWFEDFGKKARKYQVRGLVHGEDHISQQQSLINAFETSDIGTLTLPTYGSVQVWPVTVSVINKDSELGNTEFEMTFVEAGEFSAPGDASDVRTFVDTRLSGLELVNQIRGVDAARIAKELEIRLSGFENARNQALNPDGTPFPFNTPRTTKEILEKIDDKDISSLVNGLKIISSKTNLDDFDHATIRHYYGVINNKLNEIGPTLETGIFLPQFGPTYNSRQDIVDLRAELFDIFNDHQDTLISQSRSDEAIALSNAFTPLERSLEGAIGTTQFSRQFLIRNGPVPLPVALTQISSALGQPVNADNSTIILDRNGHTMAVSFAEATETGFGRVIRILSNTLGLNN